MEPSLSDSVQKTKEGAKTDQDGKDNSSIPDPVEESKEKHLESPLHSGHSKPIFISHKEDGKLVEELRKKFQMRADQHERDRSPLRIESHSRVPSRASIIRDDSPSLSSGMSLIVKSFFLLEGLFLRTLGTDSAFSSPDVSGSATLRGRSLSKSVLRVLRIQREHEKGFK
jgi:hypothetical protein